MPRLGLRILMVSQYFHPENFRINQLAVALSRQGHEVTVITGQPNYPSGRFSPGYGFVRPLVEQYQGIRVVRVPVFARGRGRAWQLVLNYLSFAFFATSFGLPRARGGFDVCMAWCPSPITSAIPAVVYRLLHSTPLVIWLQDLWPEVFFAVTKSRSRLLHRLLASLVRFIHRHADQIWTQSPGFVASVRAHGGVGARIEYVPNWAEDLYDCAQWGDVAADRIPEDALVFAGNLGRAQGLETLIEAAEIARTVAPSAHWVFVGDGTLRDWLAQQVSKRSLADRVTILPRRPPQEMPKILKPAAALLVTLGDEAAFSQTIPSKLQSCLAAGRPVIGALSGEAARVIQEAECGYVCPANDASALAAIIKRFLELSVDEREALGRNGHAFYKAHFTETRIMSQVNELLEQMAGRAKPAETSGAME
jgi:colanic acid biosynthesis glycosyl transferase WcaI